jgi:hypothetical protein
MNASEVTRSQWVRAWASASRSCWSLGRGLALRELVLDHPGHAALDFADGAVEPWREAVPVRQLVEELHQLEVGAGL